MWARETCLRFPEPRGFVLLAWDGFRHVSAGLVAVPVYILVLPDPDEHVPVSP